MKMNNILFFAAITICLSFKSASAQQTKKTNVVVIMADDMGYECIGAYGGTSYQTPNIDKMAKEGMLFTNAHAQPICTPSRVEIMTGKYNVRNYSKFAELTSDQITFGNLFKEAGYRTAIVGKWQLSGGYEAPKNFGFDNYCLWRLISNDNISRYPNPGIAIDGKFISHDDGSYGPDVMVNYATNFIKENKNKPFLLYYPMLLVHNPFEATPDSDGWNPKSKGKDNGPKNDDYNDLTYFPPMMKYMDKNVAKILKTLKDVGVDENTLVIFTGDNGTTRKVVSMVNGKEVEGGKGLTTDNGTHVPLIARWPKTIAPNQINDNMVDFSDILPTICEASAIKIDEKLKTEIDGISFLPQLKKEKYNPRTFSYCWYLERTSKTDVSEYVHNPNYKLYSTGKFYNLKNDIHEKKPLSDASLTSEELTIKNDFKKQLDYYSLLRPEHLKIKNKNSGEKKIKKNKQKKIEND